MSVRHFLPAQLTHSWRIHPLFIFTIVGLGGAWSAQGAPVSFSKEIAPILLDKCQTCHQDGKARGSYRVDTFEMLLKTGDSEEIPVVPGKPDEGIFFHLLVTDDEDERMPQKDDPLPREQIDLFRRWIAEGAKFDGPDRNKNLNELVAKPDTARAPEKYPQPLPITAMTWLKDGQTLAVAGYHEVTLWNTAEGKLIRRIGGLPERIFAMRLHPDGKRIAVGGGVPGRSGEMMVVNIESGQVEKALPMVKDTVLATAFSPDGAYMAFAGADNTVRLYATNGWKELWKIEAHADWVTDLSFAPDNKHLVSSSRDRTARVFNTSDGQQLITYTSHEHPVNAVTFTSDGKAIYSAGKDGQIRRWDVVAALNGTGGVGETVIAGRRVEVTRLDGSENRVVALSVDGRVRSYDSTKKKDDKPVDLSGFSKRPDAVAFDPVGKRLAVAGQEGRVVIVKMGEKAPLKSFIAAPGW